MSDEQHLIERAKAGSVDAFTELVGAYRHRLLRFLVTRCPSYADAEDALQDTLLNAFRYLASYDARWRFSTWLYRIAIRNAMRETPPTEALDEIGDPCADPLRACIQASEGENLWLTARSVLNDEVFTAMWLRYAEELSVADVARVLDRSVSWSKVNLMRGRRALADALTEREEQQSEAYG